MTAKPKSTTFLMTIEQLEDQLDRYMGVIAELQKAQATLKERGDRGLWVFGKSTMTQAWERASKFRDNVESARRALIDGCPYREDSTRKTGGGAS